jgi:alanine racemase
MFNTPILTVDLAAIVGNWQLLRKQFSGAETAAVVKADAYGLGMIPVAAALAKAGCDTFFVATIEEALTLRETLPDVRILVFSGVGNGEEFAYLNHRIIPVLNSREQIARWKPVAAEHVHAVSALHIDTAMGRLGLQPDDFHRLMDEDKTFLEACRVGLVMSHLACGPEAQHPVNPQQLTLFSKARARAPGIPASLANSAGIFLDTSYHFDLARPGCSLYGIAPQEEGKNPMAQVAEWTAPILQIRVTDRDQGVSYGASAKVKKGTRIATVATGYADGYMRILSNKAVAYLGLHKVTLLGRVTMDMLCFDVSQVPESELAEGNRITLLGNKDGIRVDELARTASTIGYEVFTHIGSRVKRHYN